jgi:hypothetical protein
MSNLTKPPQKVPGTDQPFDPAVCGGADLNIFEKLKVLIPCHPDDLHIVLMIKAETS